MTTTQSVPRGWSEAVHAHWSQGQKDAAISALMKEINQYGPKKPRALVIQLSYYAYLLKDIGAVCAFLEATCPYYPDDMELRLNLAVSLSKLGKQAQSIAHLEKVIALDPNAFVAWDSLASNLHDLKRDKEASVAGTQALIRKDALKRPQAPDWKAPEDWAGVVSKAERARRVVAFSLWGSGARYLRGAIDNALAMPNIYPGWESIFFVDETVPQDVRNALTELGAQVRLQPAGQPQRQKLAWRFLVANEAGVGRFLVRDVDSVVNERERAAVDDWIRSDCIFHVMRDWWTHTDLVLAGMWGGIAGLLPPVPALLASYRPPHMETPNIDQWFLRDILWPCIRQSCLIHDRCFNPPGTKHWPTPTPPGNLHVGQDVYTAARKAQEQRLAAWIDRLPSLQDEQRIG